MAFIIYIYLVNFELSAGIFLELNFIFLCDFRINGQVSGRY